jgi:hypothetical protein
LEAIPGLARTAKHLKAEHALIKRFMQNAMGALFVLMGKLQTSEHPEVLANTAKHFAFTRCGEFNLFGMVDTQIAVMESELLATFTS